LNPDSLPAAEGLSAGMTTEADTAETAGNSRPRLAWKRHFALDSPWAPCYYFPLFPVADMYNIYLKGAGTMSGHNKWSTIKHKKGATDAKRGKVFTKIIKEISVAAKLGGADPVANPRLRTAIDKAKAENMPKDNIERAIKKGAGGMEGVTYEEIVYEGYGPGGAAVLVEVMTDNRNRSVSEVRSIFSKNNGNMGEAGCVSWMFSKKGLILYDKSVDFEQLFEAAIEVGADDVAEQDEQFEVTTDLGSFIEVREALAAKGFKHADAEITMIPQTMVVLEGKQAESMLRLMDKMEDCDDVQNVYSNFDISAEEMENLI
jgi:YebC/PmpR family DNA-binding regulatory protein